MTTAGELASVIGGVVVGDPSLCVSGVSSVEDAEPGTVVIAENKRYFDRAVESQASVIVTTNGGECAKTVIRVEDTSQALLSLLEVFQPEPMKTETGISSGSSVGKGLQCGRNLTVGHGACIGENVVVGDDVVIHPNAYIGDNVRLGDEVVIYPNVTIYPGSEIGSRVTVHAGSVIGSDGFGYVLENGKHRKVPQVGKVVIEDDVEIGACSAIDRAKFGVTRIGRGTKIDNLVHIAHNCKIGEGCVIVAQVGIAGSTVVGNGVVIAGQAGVKDHVNIGDRAVVAARSGVIGNVESGALVSGYPARGHQEFMKAHALFLRLPEVLKSLKELEAKLSALEAQVQRNGEDVAADHQ